MMGKITHDKTIHFRPTTYGFEYGSAKIERLASDSKQGWVVIEIRTPKAMLQVYVTKTGKMRLKDALTREEIFLEKGRR